MGNWDAWAVDGFPHGQGQHWARFVEQGEWWAAKLSAEDLAFIRTFVPRLELELDGVPVLCFHGSPTSYDDMILATTPHEDVVRMFAGLPHALMLGGHTHVQLVRAVEGTLLLNPGSVGLPFRGVPAGQLQRISPWAEYALVRVDDGSLSVELRRTAYDVDEMLRRTIESGVPHASWWAETWMTKPPAHRLG
jgi:predicted phosphodiesterase